MAGPSSRQSSSFDDALSLYSTWLASDHPSPAQYGEAMLPASRPTPAVTSELSGKQPSAELVQETGKGAQTLRKRKSIDYASAHDAGASQRAGIGLGLGMQLDERDEEDFATRISTSSPSSSSTARVAVSPERVTRIVGGNATKLVQPPPSLPLPALPLSSKPRDGRAGEHTNKNPYLSVHLYSAEPLSPSVASHHPGSSLIHQDEDTFPSLISDHRSSSVSGRGLELPREAEAPSSSSGPRQRVKTNDTTASTTGDKSPGLDGHLVESFPSPPQRPTSKHLSPKLAHLDVVPAPPRKLVAVNQNASELSSPSVREVDASLQAKSMQSPSPKRRSKEVKDVNEDGSDDDLCLAYLAQRKRGILTPNRETSITKLEDEPDAARSFGGVEVPEETKGPANAAARDHFSNTLRLNLQEAKLFLGAAERSPNRPANRGADRLDLSRRQTPSPLPNRLDKEHKPLPSLPLHVTPAEDAQYVLDSGKHQALTTLELVRLPPTLKHLRSAGELHAWTVGIDGAGCPHIAPRPSAFHHPSCSFAGHPVVTTRLCGCRALSSRTTKDDNQPAPLRSLHSNTRRPSEQSDTAPSLGFLLRATASAPNLLDVAAQDEKCESVTDTTREGGDKSPSLVAESQLGERKLRLEEQKRELDKLSKMIARMSHDVRHHRAMADMRKKLKEEERQRSLAASQAAVQVPVRGSSHWWLVDDKGDDDAPDDPLRSSIPPSPQYAGSPQTRALAISAARKKTSAPSPAPINDRIETTRSAQVDESALERPLSPKRELSSIARWAKKMPSASSLAKNGSLMIKAPLRRMGSMELLSSPIMKTPSPLPNKDKPLPSPVQISSPSPSQSPASQQPNLPISAQSPSRKVYPRISTIRSHSREDVSSGEIARAGSRLANSEAKRSRNHSEDAEKAADAQISPSILAAPLSLKESVSGRHPPSTQHTRPEKQQYQEYASHSPSAPITSPPRTPRTPVRKAKKSGSSTGRHTPSASYSSSVSASSMSTSSSFGNPNNTFSQPSGPPSTSVSPRSAPIKVRRARGDSISTVATTVLDEEEEEEEQDELDDAYKRLVEDQQRAASAMVSSFLLLKAPHELKADSLSR